MAAACGRSSGTDAAPSIRLVHPAGAPSVVEVAGLPPRDLASLKEMEGDDAWQVILSVSVRTGLPPVIGCYATSRGALRFTPQFPFDPGRTYSVRFDPTKLPSSAWHSDPWRAQPVTAEVSMPSGATPRPAHVRRVFPSSNEWPANQLRVYVEFSDPMSTRGGVKHLHILDDTGTEIVDPFLPLDYDFWNVDRTRFTAFMDPGRVKSGLVPRDQMGPSLLPGKRYTLVVDADWRDTYGQPLKEAFRREFATVAPDLTPINLATWTISVPRGGTSESVTVDFGESLDRQLLLRSLAIRAADGQIVPGDIHLEPGEAGWTFEPENTLPPGRYELVSLSILEDLAGNQIGRPFEVDTFTRVESSEPTTVARSFTIR